MNDKIPHELEGESDGEGFSMRYRVERIDGLEDPPGTQYFVLRVGDEHAGRAIMTYVDAVAKDSPTEAGKIVDWLSDQGIPDASSSQWAIADRLIAGVKIPRSSTAHQNRWPVLEMVTPTGDSFGVAAFELHCPICSHKVVTWPVRKQGLRIATCPMGHIFRV